ncbi:hypothetical protein NMG60_11007044 [Bertholletia excelsa]
MLVYHYFKVDAKLPNLYLIYDKYKRREHSYIILQLHHCFFLGTAHTRNGNLQEYIPESVNNSNKKIGSKESRFHLEKEITNSMNSAFIKLTNSLYSALVSFSLTCELIFAKISSLILSFGYLELEKHNIKCK